MDEIEAMMAAIAKKYGPEGMRAIATLMHGFGSETTIEFADDTWVPCDFIMQMAWANGGQPQPTDEG